ncbi:hypothetical protein [Streptomyces sp. S.PB5]|nr:hypothetical protein [Streptomyces sp. S.PB5]MDN3028570.1 hypothetical protein [Streptomyces sp. S.PB5]
MNFLAAGGDMTLTVKSRTASDGSFRAKADAVVHRVLTAIFGASLLRCG